MCVCVCSSAESEELAVHLYPGAVTVQGVLRRKTVLKEGKKPTVRATLHPSPVHILHLVSPCDLIHRLFLSFPKFPFKKDDFFFFKGEIAHHIFLLLT